MRGRGPDQTQRVRRTYRDQGDSREHPNGSPSFDVGRVDRLLRTIVRVRFVATTQPPYTMACLRTRSEAILAEVGVSDSVLKLTPHIAPDLPSVQRVAEAITTPCSPYRVADRFSIQVDCGLLFVHERIVSHAGPMYEMAHRQTHTNQGGRNPNALHWFPQGTDARCPI